MLGERRSGLKRWAPFLVEAITLVALLTARRSTATATRKAPISKAAALRTAAPELRRPSDLLRGELAVGVLIEPL